MNNDNLVLCYVKEPWAYFTDQPLDKQWGDDWNDAPYEHNAGEPYCHDDGRIIKVAYYAELVTPCDGLLNSIFSVQAINAGQIAWLRTNSWSSKQIAIPAGTTLATFRKLVADAGGEVYEATPQTEDTP